MKSKLALILRKWADLVDPNVKPSQGITFHINIDARDAIKEIEHVEHIVKRAIASCEVMKARVPLS